MGKLDGAIGYLIGPIDRVKDLGKKWRQDLIKKLSYTKIKFLDPTNKLRGLTKEVDGEQVRIKALKKNEQWEELSLLMKQVVRSDLRCIDYADFVIMYVDPGVHMFGSIHELTVAVNQKKPILVVIKGGKTKASSWLYGIVDYNFIFDSFEELYIYISKIDSGEVELNNRWVLIRKQLQNKNNTSD